VDAAGLQVHRVQQVQQVQRVRQVRRVQRVLPAVVPQVSPTVAVEVEVAKLPAVERFSAAAVEVAALSVPIL